MANELARLVVPALRWDRAHGFRYLEGLIDDALELGVGGFLVDGGPRDAVAALIGRLHADAPHPLLIAIRAECGAGETIEGLNRLPPLGALSSIAVTDNGGTPALDVEPIRRAARLTARELRNIGANWALAPNCGAGTGIRDASEDPAVVGAVIGEWIDACQAEAVIATAMSYTGRSTPSVAAAIDAGATCVMAANATGIDGTLRGTMQFDGFVATRLFDHDPSITPQNEAAVALESITAGCDVILAPGDLDGVVDALSRAASARTLGEARLRAATERVARWAGWGRPTDAREVSLDDVMWSRQVADAAVRYVRGERPRIGASVEIDRIGAFPDGGNAFAGVLESMHITVRTRGDSAASGRDPLVILFQPIGDQVSKAESQRVIGEVKRASDDGRDVLVIAFCHPRVAERELGQVPVLSAWEPSAPMQQAAARALFSRSAR
jgi:hypothetical protein